MAAYLVLVTGKMIATIRIMQRAKRVICMGEKRDAYKKCIVKTEGHDHFEDMNLLRIT
jgi:hypothetical protein